MIHRAYRAEFTQSFSNRGFRGEFAQKTVVLNIYVMPDGKYEQFMVEDQI